MTSRGKSAVRGYEQEIEKSREEGSWKKSVELALQLKARSPQHESLSHFLVGEGKLEAFLDEWPPCKENIERAQRELSEARGFLTLASNEAGKKAGVALDADLLMGKLNYACGEYAEALKHFKHAELNTLTEKELPIRSLRIVAESFAIKGLCLEEIGPTASSRYKQAERDAELIRSFELASDLALLYLQRTSGLTPATASAARAGPVLETALQRVPILHIRAQRLHHAIDRYREMLMAVEASGTQALRLTLARQLAEVLKRGVTGQVYKAPVAATGSLLRRRDESVSEGPWKPKKYQGINQFVPNNEYEEVVLVLLVGEAMAVRDAVLSQAEEFATARNHALHNAVALVDLLALVVARWGQLCLVLESLERAMKFSFGCRHVWRQRALATAAAAVKASPRHPVARPEPAAPGSSSWALGVRADAVARRALPLAPDDAPLRLVAANTCYSLGWLEEGIALSESALKIEEEQNGESEMLARACLCIGSGYQLQAQKTFDRIEKEVAEAACLTYLQRAAQLDPRDATALQRLALTHARQGRLNDAMDACRACLHNSPENAGGLRLAAALWSCACAGARGGRALSAARLARHHYPQADWPLAALAELQILWESGEAALATGKELLQLLHGEELDDDLLNGYAELDALSDSTRRETPSHRAYDAASVRASSLGGANASATAGAASVTGTAAGAHAGGSTWRALSDVSEHSRTGEPRLAHRAHAWLTLADLCLKLGRISAAAGCVAEAAALTPLSHLVLYTRGQVHAASGEWREARTCFENALALHPTHLDTIVHLGAAYYELGWLRLAEKSLREAALLAPSRADTWRRLALVLQALGEPAAAADAAAAALLLQPTTAALPLPL